MDPGELTKGLGEEEKKRYHFDPPILREAVVLHLPATLRTNKRAVLDFVRNTLNRYNFGREAEGDAESPASRLAAVKKGPLRGYDRKQLEEKGRAVEGDTIPLVTWSQGKRVRHRAGRRGRAAAGRE
jgi:hypothetical protein